MLTEEDDDEFFDLHIVKHEDKEVSQRSTWVGWGTGGELYQAPCFPSCVQLKAEASWDSTVHECPQLSRATASDRRVYLTVKAALQLSHPAHMQLVLRKRICVSVAGRQVSGPRVFSLNGR